MIFGLLQRPAYTQRKHECLHYHCCQRCQTLLHAGVGVGVGSGGLTSLWHNALRHVEPAHTSTFTHTSTLQLFHLVCCTNFGTWAILLQTAKCSCIGHVGLLASVWWGVSWSRPARPCVATLCTACCILLGGLCSLLPH